VTSQLNDPTEINVFNLVAKNRSIPFLELLDVTELDEQQLQGVLKSLENLNLVKITGREDVVKEYVSLAGAAALGAYR
jgi:predicted transcriptional regulator